jgi:hypothetical protein
VSGTKRLATSLVVACVLLGVARFVLALSTGSLADQGGVVANAIFDISSLLFVALFLFVGWSIVTRQPRNTIGWLLLTIPLIAVLALFCGDYATQALATDPARYRSASPPRGSTGG